MMTLKNNGPSPFIAIQKSSKTLEFVITNQKIKINCTLESLIHRGNEVYVLFRDMGKKLYAYLVKAPYSDRPSLIEPTSDVQNMLINEYERSLLTI